MKVSKVARTLKELAGLCFRLTLITAPIMLVAAMTEGWDRDIVYKLAILSMPFSGFMGLVFFIGAQVASHFRTQAILARGKGADAVILRFSDTGAEGGPTFPIKLFLEVQPGDQEPFQEEAKWGMPRLQAAKLQTGAKLRVKYDPRTLDVAVVSFAD